MALERPAAALSLAALAALAAVPRLGAALGPAALLAAVAASARGLEESGVLEALAARLAQLPPRRAAALLALAEAASAALATNDVAVMVFTGLLARLIRDPVWAAAVSAFSANLGAAASPLGSPQSILAWSLGGARAASYVSYMLPAALMGAALAAPAAALAARGPAASAAPRCPSLSLSLALLSASSLAASVAAGDAGYPWLAPLAALPLVLLKPEVVRGGRPRSGAPGVPRLGSLSPSGASSRRPGARLGMCAAGAAALTAPRQRRCGCSPPRPRCPVALRGPLD